jgi:hypothetical protein
VKKESFLGLLLTACTVAQHTQRKEKIARIRNATVYCAQYSPRPEQVDSFFHLLQFLSDNLTEFSSMDKFSQVFALFNKSHPGLSSDAFGHYFYDLKFRRLIRISPVIEDDEGLTASVIMSTGEVQGGEVVIISAVARQLLAITQG